MPRERKTTLDKVQIVPLSSWNKIHDHSQKDWIFRGMKNSTWALETALERKGWKRNGQTSNLAEKEKTILREFQRRYRHYSQHPPRIDDTLEWLSVMQHHGAPTRLLDWSYSIYVAAYFSLEETKSECAVWALNTKWLFKELEKLYEDRRYKKFLTKGIEDTYEHRALFRDIFLDNVRKPFVASFSPFRMDERLTIQKGTFLVPSDLSKRFEANLSDMPGYDKKKNLKRIIIPHSVRNEAIESLFNMNISRATLYPGLDGFSSSLGIYHPKVGWQTE